MPCAKVLDIPPFLASSKRELRGGAALMAVKNMWVCKEEDAEDAQRLVRTWSPNLEGHAELSACRDPPPPFAVMPLVLAGDLGACS